MALQHTKHFTVDQAARMLSGITHLVREIADLKRKLDERGFDIYRHQYFGGRGPNGERAFPPELQKLVQIVKNLTKKGVIIKSLEEGLIDFPHIRSNGEEVYLCWKLDEKEIGFWHTLENGYAGRRPLVDL
jgi:hypothetical protein